ncbi:MAG: sulfotransferase [Gammaproteobacteria bacterium]
MIEPGASMPEIEADLRQALEAQPGDPQLLARLAEIEIEAGRLGAAADTLRSLIQAQPDAEVFERLGSVLNRLGRFQEALPALRQALDLQPGNATAWNSAGEALGNIGRFSEAVNAFARAVDLRPDFAHAHYNLGLALRAAGKAESAAGVLARAAELAPDAVEPLQALAHQLHSLGRYQQAARAYRKLVELRPDDPAAHTSLGTSLHMLGDLLSARDCYQRALELSPDYAQAHSNLGTVYQSLRDVEEADACFRRALSVAPGHQDALAGLATNLDRRGSYAEGWALIEHGFDPARSGLELVITGAQLQRHLGNNLRAAEILQLALERQDLNDASRQRLHFNLGHALNAESRYEEAFDNYRRGNKLKPVRFNGREYDDDVRRLLRVYAPQNAATLARAENDDERPVFVLGMPRSGTSLVEQILACHAQIAGAGELLDLGRLAISLGQAEGLRFPDSAASASQEALESAASEYSDCLSAVDTTALRVIDKTPANYLFLGFVEQMFPNAHVIHCVRHPLDTALSCYFQNFAGQGIPFSYRLDNIVTYYNRYLEVMEHWRNHTSLAFHEVVYEELVTGQEAISRQLVNFLGLEWDPACLGFHESGRLVATASHAQVRRPMYHTSLGRYRHYRDWIGPLIEGIDWDAWHRSGFADRVDSRIPEMPEPA